MPAADLIERVPIHVVVDEEAGQHIAGRLLHRQGPLALVGLELHELTDEKRLVLELVLRVSALDVLKQRRDSSTKGR